MNESRAFGELLECQAVRRVVLATLLTSASVFAVLSACSDDPVKPPQANNEAGTSSSSSSGEGGPADGKAPSLFEGCRAGVFGAPEPITTLNTDGRELSLRLSDDELTGVVTAGNDDLYVIKRGELSDSFGLPSAVAGVNTATSSETHGMLSDEKGLTIYFDSDRPGGKGGRDIWSATRGDAGAAFDTPKPFAIVNDTLDDGHPYLAGGGNLYFASNRGGAGAHIFLSKSLGAPEPVALATASEKEDDFPIVSQDQRELFFASSRPGGKGFKSIWVADRASANAPFGAPRLVKELDSDGDDRPTWISLDGCRLYIVSDRAGTFDILVSTRE